MARRSPRGTPTVLDLDEATAFPIMVSDGQTLTLGGPAAAPGAPADLGATALSAIKNVLGWSWRPGADPKGLVGALNTSFKAIPRQGRVDYEYQQKNYAVAIQADMGMLTGAQASLYTRAKATLDQSLLLLSGLVPLLPDPDPGETEAFRALVRTEITDIVQQLGAEGGPNVQLVDNTFTFLGGASWNVKGTGTSAKTQTFDTIGGHLGAMRVAFGLEERWVNTIPEEQDLTNYIVLVDWVNDLFSNWRTNRTSFLVGSTKKTFMGTQLIQVSRALAVVAEAVDQLCYVMDTVFIQKAERQTLKITYGDGQPAIFFGDLLEWIRNFVTSEGHQIISDSGKEGMQTFTATAQRLQGLVQGAKIAKSVPVGFKTRRVQDALDNLAEQLGTAIGEAQSIRRYPPPTIELVDVDSEIKTERLRVSVYGRGLSDSATIALGWTDRDKPVISEVEKSGVIGEAFVSAPTVATAIFAHPEAKTKLGASKPPGNFGLRVVIRNDDDQADSMPLTDGQAKVVL